MVFSLILSVFIMLINSDAPFERMYSAMVGVFRVESAQFKIRAVRRQSHAYPTRRSARQEWIRCRRQVNEMNAAWLMFHDIPVVCMTVNNCLYLVTSFHFFHERGGIHEARLVIVELRVMMHEHDGRFFGARVQFLRQPVKLRRADFARRVVCAVERVQLEPIHPRGG